MFNPHNAPEPPRCQNPACDAPISALAYYDTGLCAACERRALLAECRRAALLRREAFRSERRLVLA